MPKYVSPEKMAKKRTADKKKMAKGETHKMPNGMVMTDAEMQAMMSKLGISKKEMMMMSKVEMQKMRKKMKMM